MGFFIKKKMENDATKPLEETPEAKAEESTEGVEKTKKEKVVADKVEEDRSAFNCGTCNGEGLVWHEGVNKHERCGSCGGTGKVN